MSSLRDSAIQRSQRLSAAAESSILQFGVLEVAFVSSFHRNAALRTPECTSGLSPKVLSDERGNQKGSGTDGIGRSISLLFAFELPPAKPR
jgi:hypothetical protein